MLCERASWLVTEASTRHVQSADKHGDVMIFAGVANINAWGHSLVLHEWSECPLNSPLLLSAHSFCPLLTETFLISTRAPHLSRMVRSSSVRNDVMGRSFLTCKLSFCRRHSCKTGCRSTKY